MRSPMVASLTDKEDEARYTDLQVLQSAAGWYIGTMYNNPEGYTEPGSRDSYDYYPTQEAAQHALDTKTWVQRTHP